MNNRSTEQTLIKDQNSNQESTVSFSPIVSITDAEARMIEWDKSSSLPDFILDSLEKDNERSETAERIIFGSADEYHNLASEFARNSLYKGASIIASYGAMLYKFNVDLLADIIKFSSKTQDWASCEKAVDRLETIPRARWGWRAFTFLIDYLFDRLEVSSPNRYAALEKEIMQYIAAYKKIGDERAWVAESKLYLLRGQREKAVNILMQGVEAIRVVPQISVRLSDLLLQDGRYEEVIKYAAIGIRSTAEDQPSANTGYLIYVSALAKDAIIHEEDYNHPADPEKGFSDKEKICSALTDYEIARDLLRRSNPIYIANIEQRIKILKKKSGMVDRDTETPNETVVRNFLTHLASESTGS